MSKLSVGVKQLQFNRDKMSCPVTKIHKTGPLLKNKKVERLALVADRIEKCFGGRFLYDITYGGDTSWSTMTGTELLSSAVFVHPCNYTVRDNQILAASKEASEEDVISRILAQDKNMDKYRLIRQPFFGEVDSVVFLPGSNIYSTVVNLDIVTEAVKNGALVKPHPVTNGDILEQQKQLWGSSVLSSKISGWDVLTKASTVYCAGNSEMGIYAVMLGKDIISYEKFQTNRNPAYRPLFNLVLNHEDPYQALNNVFNSHKSGIFFVWDNDQKIKAYLNYAKTMINGMREDEQET